LSQCLEIWRCRLLAFALPITSWKKPTRYYFFCRSFPLHFACIFELDCHGRSGKKTKQQPSSPARARWSPKEKQGQHCIGSLLEKKPSAFHDCAQTWLAYLVLLPYRATSSQAWFFCHRLHIRCVAIVLFVPLTSSHLMKPFGTTNKPKCSLDSILLLSLAASVCVTDQHGAVGLFSLLWPLQSSIEIRSKCTEGTFDLICAGKWLSTVASSSTRHTVLCWH